MAHNVAEELVNALVRAGTRRIYGIVGDSLNPVTDAIRRDGKIQWVDVRHEEAGAFAAGAEAQLTGQLAVCAGSCGPGNLHLINGLYDAHRSGAPVLAIAAHIPSSEIGTGYFQELARTFDAMADRLQGRAHEGTQNLEAAFSRLRDSVRNSGPADAPGALAANLRTFLPLSERITGLAVSLSMEI